MASQHPMTSGAGQGRGLCSRGARGLLGLAALAVLCASDRTTNVAQADIALPSKDGGGLTLDVTVQTPVAHLSGFSPLSGESVALRVVLRNSTAGTILVPLETGLRVQLTSRDEGTRLSGFSPSASIEEAELTRLEAGRSEIRMLRFIVRRHGKCSVAVVLRNLTPQAWGRRQDASGNSVRVLTTPVGLWQGNLTSEVALEVRRRDTARLASEGGDWAIFDRLRTGGVSDLMERFSLLQRLSIEQRNEAGLFIVSGVLHESTVPSERIVCAWQVLTAVREGWGIDYVVALFPPDERIAGAIDEAIAVEAAGIAGREAATGLVVSPGITESYSLRIPSAVTDRARALLADAAINAKQIRVRERASLLITLLNR